MAPTVRASGGAVQLRMASWFVVVDVCQPRYHRLEMNGLTGGTPLRFIMRKEYSYPNRSSLHGSPCMW